MKNYTHALAMLCALLMAWSPTWAQSLNYSGSSYLGGSGNPDMAVGTRVMSNGNIALAVNLGTEQPGGLSPTLLNGATTTSPGAVVILNSAGTQVLSVTRLATEVLDLASDGADNLYVAAAYSGILKLDGTARNLIWKAQNGGYCRRVDVSSNGDAVGLNAVGNTAGTLYVYNATGTLVGSFPGLHFSQDVAIDHVTGHVYSTGFRQGNSNCNPVQVAYLRANTYTGTQVWKNYDWPGPALDNCNPGVTTNLMADTRGYRVTLGLDGKLYVAFEAAGGNHIFTKDPKNLSTNVSIVGGDSYHTFSNTGAEHKTFFARYEPSNGNYLQGQQLTNRLTNGDANAIRVKDGDIRADSDGRVYLGGNCATGLPTLTFNHNTSETDAGAWFMVFSPGFVREYVTRFNADGNCQAMDVRYIAGKRRLVIAGRTNNSFSLYTKNAFQNSAVGGTQDGFVVTLGDSTLLAHYVFDNNANDFSGKGNHATLSNASYSTTSRVGSHSLQTGTTAFATTPTLTLGNNFTIAGWVRTDVTTSGEACLVSNTGSAATASGFKLYVSSVGSNDRSIKLVVGNGSTTSDAGTTTNTITHGQWAHVALVVKRTAGIAKVYVNGSLASVDSTIQTDFGTSGTIYLGRTSNGSSSLTGLLDEVRISTEALSAAEVARLAAYAIPSAPSTLTASSVGSSSINLSWADNANNEAGFVIERKQGAGAYSTLAQVAANTTSYQDAALSASTSYTYRISALNLSGQSVTSNEASATTSAIIHPFLYASESRMVQIRNAIQVPGSTHKAAYEAMKARVDQNQWQVYDENLLDSNYNYARSWLAREAAFMYLITRDTTYSNIAFNALYSIHATPDPENRLPEDGYGLARAMVGIGFAMAYDWCYDGWSPSRRDYIKGKITLALDAWTTFSHPNLSDPSMGSNWVAVCRSAELLMMVSVNEQSNRSSRYAQLKSWLNTHMQTAYGDQGVSQEGSGYTSYGGSFLMMGVYALQSVGDAQLNAEFNRHKFWKLITFSNSFIESDKAPHITSSHQISWGVGSVYTVKEGWRNLAFNSNMTAEERAAYQFAYDKFEGILHPFVNASKFDYNRGGAPFALLYYPENSQARNPAEVVGHSLVDDGQGMGFFRNRWQDGNDIIISMTADASWHDNAWDKAEATQLNIFGFNNVFASGPKSETQAAFFSTLKVDNQNDGVAAGTTGQLVTFEPKTGGGGYMIVDGADKYRTLGVDTVQRHLLVDYSKANAPGIFSVLDVVRDATTHTYTHNLRLGYEGADSLASTTGTESGRPFFRIQGKGNSYLKAWVLSPAGATITENDKSIQVNVSGVAKADIWIAAIIDSNNTTQTATITGTGLASVWKLGTQEIYFNPETQRVNVRPAGGPFASFTASQETGVPPATINFNAAGTFDTDSGTIVSYAWDFGNGLTGTGLNASTTYNTGGLYTVRLTVTDNDGKVSEATKSIKISEALSINFGNVDLSSIDTAGVVGKRFWTKLNTGATAFNLRDDAGLPSSASARYYGSGPAYVYASADIETNGDSKMMRHSVGVLGGTLSVEVSNVPAVLQQKGYDVYVYYGSHNTDTKTPAYKLGELTYFIRDNTATWNGIHSRSTATTAATAVAGNNYVRFTGVTGNNLLLAITGGGGAQRFGISGLQLVASNAAPATAPAAVSNLTASALSATRVVLNWTDNSYYERGFIVQRKLTNGGTYQTLDTLGVNATTFAEAGLTAFTSYTYRITPYNAAGNGTGAEVVLTTQPVNPPAALMAATQSISAIALTWADSAFNETGYGISISTDNVTFSPLATLAANSTSYTATGLDTITTYYFRVWAFNANGNSTNATASATTLDIPPFTPTMLTATARSWDRIRLTWNDVAYNETGYRIERRTAGQPFSLVTTLPAGTALYDDNNLQPVSTYYYRVTALNAYGWSDSVEAVGKTLSSAEFDIISVNVGPQSMTSGDAAGVLAASNWTNVNSSSASNLRNKDNVATTASISLPGTTYAYTSTDANTSSGSHKMMRSLRGVLGTTMNVVLSNLPTSFQTNGYDVYVYWGNHESVTRTQSYTLGSQSFFLTDNNPAFEGSFAKSQATTAAAAQQGHNYVQFRDINLATCSLTISNGITSRFGISGLQIATLTSAVVNPAQPSGLVAQAASPTVVNLSWSDNANNETGYVIERRLQNGAYAVRTQLAANAVAYQDTGLSPETVYQYRVYAVNATGYSQFSVADTAQTPALLVPPVAPSSLTLVATSTSSITLTWADNSTGINNQEQGFIIERRTTNGSFTVRDTVASNITTWADAGLSAYTWYTYRVRAYNTKGVSAYCIPDSARTLPVMKVISLNFGSTTLATTDVAGVVAKANWNNVGTSASNLKDDGNSTTAASANVSGTTYVYSSTLIGTSNGDQKLMKSSRGALSASFSIAVSGLPSEFTTQGYKVYVYWGGHDGAATRTPSYTLNGQTFFMRDNNGTWNGTHALSAASTAASAVQDNNYVLFSNQTASSLTLSVAQGGGGQRYGVCGMQIVTGEPETRVTTLDNTVSETVSQVPSLQFVPNPVNADECRLLWKNLPADKAVSLQLYDARGQQVRSINGNTATLESLDLTGLPAGVYLAKGLAGEQVILQRLVKR